MFGLLNEAEKKSSLDPKDYEKGRGRFYMIWNCLNNSGRPMLIALMAGRAAHDAEVTDTNTLLKEVTERLGKTFAPQIVPAPVEVIVTRWKKDPFTRGTYSFVGPETQPGDYDVMANPVGNLHFAGEATCGTHPATVHGAYLSGLRAAAEVIESMIGPLDAPQPLIHPKEHVSSAFGPTLPRPVTINSAAAPKIRLKATKPKAIYIKQEVTDSPTILTPSQVTPPIRNSNNSRSTFDEENEALIQSAILTEIGHRPFKPGRPGVNPFLMYTNDHWNSCKEQESEVRRKQTGNPDAKATRNEVRIALGRDWRNAGDEVRRPYLQRCETAQQQANEARVQYERDLVKWEEDAKRIRVEFWRKKSTSTST